MMLYSPRDMAAALEIEPQAMRKMLHDYRDIIPSVSPPADSIFFDARGSLDRPYKYYDDNGFNIVRLIYVYKILGIERKDIKEKIRRGDSDRNQILDEQLILLKKQKDKLERLIQLTSLYKVLGINNNSLSNFPFHLFTIFSELTDDELMLSEYQQEYESALKRLLAPKNEDTLLEIASLVESFIEKMKDLQADNEQHHYSESEFEQLAKDKLTPVAAELTNRIIKVSGVAGSILIYSLGYSAFGESNYLDQAFSSSAVDANVAKAICAYLFYYIHTVIDNTVPVLRATLSQIDILAANDQNDPCIKEYIKNAIMIVEDNFGANCDKLYILLFKACRDFLDKERHLPATYTALINYLEERKTI